MNLIDYIKKQDFFDYCESMNNMIKNMPECDQERINKLMLKFIKNYNAHH